MDFFALQDQARRRTVHLFLLYLLALGAVILLLFLATGAVVEGFRLFLPDPETPKRPAWQDLHLLGWIATYVFLIVGGGIIYRWLDLRNGGGAVARLFRARRIDTANCNQRERQLINVVEEMAIAAGMAVPEVFILERQRSINAMAAGYSPEDAVIVLTRGALQHLNRDELQGVVAHEFSHILNGDMRLNLRLISLLNGLVSIHLAGETLLHVVYDREDAVGINLARGFAASIYGITILFLGFSLKAAGYIGAVAALLIQAGVSRQREYLADAAAVQFTRNPWGIAGALIKIGSHVQQGAIRDPHAHEASHLFIVQAVSYENALFDSHPPLLKRIRLIDPSFDGEFPPLPEPSSWEEASSAPVRKKIEPPSRSKGQPPQVLADAVAGVAALEAAQLGRAKEILNGIPATLREAVHDLPAAEALLYFLLSSDKPKAFGGLEEADRAVTDAFDRLLPELRYLSPEAILPLTEMLLPALHLLSVEQYRTLREHMKGVVDDDCLSLSGFCLQQVVMHHLDRHFDVKPPRQRTRVRLLRDIREKVFVVLGALSHAGAKDPEKALRAAKFALPHEMQHHPLPPPEECGSRQLAEALALLAQARPRLKKPMMEAAIFCVGSDQTLATSEAELLHLLAAALGLPAPGVLGLKIPPDSANKSASV